MSNANILTLDRYRLAVTRNEVARRRAAQAADTTARPVVELRPAA